MILFSLLFSSSVSEFSSDLAAINVLCKTEFSKSLPKQSARSLHLAYAIKHPNIISEGKDSLAKKQLMKRHFAQKAFNALYQQTIFLSVSSKRINKYVNQLSSLNINSRKDVYKCLVSKFSKSLFNQPLVLSETGSYNSSWNSFSSVQYPWNAALFTNLSTVFSNKKGYKSKLVYDLNTVTGLRHYPLFAVSNNLGQLVISETPPGFNSKKAFADHFSLANNCSNSQRTWFFVNHEDAEEYMQHINAHHSLEDNLKIFTCSLATFYKLADRFSNRIEFRLIPDLKEVSQLIKVYRYRNNISFDQRQKYGRMFFRGQPLYILKMVDPYVYTDALSGEKKTQVYNFAFTNYETALSVLAKCKKSSSYNNKIFNKPHLIVYNLESFIKDHVEGTKYQESTFLLVPSRFSYSFVKMAQLRKSNSLAYSSFSNHLSSTKLWLKRMLWSLTSRHPQS